MGQSRAEGLTRFTSFAMTGLFNTIVKLLSGAHQIAVGKK